MIGLLLIYFVGKAFYELAHEHNRSRWGFAILGVISYYGGTFVGGIILGLIYLALDMSIEGTNEILLSVLALPFGVLVCWGFYQILKRSWSRSSENSSPSSSEVLDADLFKDNQQ